jgi:hypothetical protein
MPHVQIARRLVLLVPLLFLLGLPGCTRGPSRYVLVEDSLRTGDTQKADLIIEQAERQYGRTNRLLYRMDRGMTLHLAGRYEASNELLEHAEQDVEELYTRRVRTEARAFLLNDAQLPYEGEPFEHVMLNVLKLLNYARLGNWHEAAVEARRVDHRLNVLADRTAAEGAYRDDASARYLTGIVYETTGDLNNALVAYRKAYDEYRRGHAWARTVPSALKSDLLRVTDSLHLSTEHDEYLQAFPDRAWQPHAELQQLAQVVVISYNGRVARKEDLFLDLPVSLDALRLVLLAKGLGGGTQESRPVESALYGMNGHVVRVALPRLVAQKTQVAYGEVSLIGNSGSFTAQTELMEDLSALARKQLDDRFSQLALKAVARAAVKYAVAEGVTRSARAAAGSDYGALVGILVRGVTHGLAIASEEADKRTWQTLPDEIQITRLWVPPGTYEFRLQSVAKGGGRVGRDSVRTVSLQAGETRLFTERVLH